MVFELPLLLLQGRRGIRGWEDVSLDEIVAVRTGVEALLEVVSCTLALEFESFGLKGTGTWLAEAACSIRRMQRCRQGKELMDIRSCGGVEQNVPVLQVLSFWAVLQVLLQAAAPLIAADRRDGGSVDGVSVLRSHVGWWLVDSG